MKLIQLFDIKTRTLGFAFCQPQKKSLPKSLTQKKSLQNFKPKKSPQIANFKPKKGLRTSQSLIYLSTPPGPTTLLLQRLPHFHDLKVAVLAGFHCIHFSLYNHLTPRSDQCINSPYNNCKENLKLF